LYASAGINQEANSTRKGWFIHMANTMKEAKTPRELITPFILALAIDNKSTGSEPALSCMPVKTIFKVFVFISTFLKVFCSLIQSKASN
jgi:hypothetical protein